MKNDYEIKGNVVYIQLNDNQITTLDITDLPAVKKVTSLYATWDKEINGYYVTCYIDGVLMKLHRFIMQPPEDLQVDHINRKTLDNRRANLRIVNQSVNTHNQRRRKDNTSGFKGVSYVKHCRKYRARVQLDGEPVYLGLFDNAEEAAKAVEKRRNAYLKGVTV